MGQTIRIGVAQYGMRTDDIRGNAEKAMRKIRALGERGSDIVLLPELFATHYFPVERKEEWFRLAWTDDHPVIREIRNIARKFRMCVLLPFFEKGAKGFYYNTTLYIDGDGNIAGKYRKVHIPAVRSIEKFYFRPGSEFPVFQAPWGTFGCLTCQDRLYPEAFRILALKGADVIFVANAAGDYANFKALWNPLHQTRACENACFIVSSNRTGTENELSFFGQSLVAAPSGDLLKCCGSEEDLLHTEIDLDHVEQMRNLLHIYRDYRPEMYREIGSFDLS